MRLRVSTGKLQMRCIMVGHKIDPIHPIRLDQTKGFQRIKGTHADDMAPKDQGQVRH